MKPSEVKLAIAMPTVTVATASGGGHLNTLRFADLLARSAEVRAVSYRRKEEGVWFLPEVEDRLAAEGWTLLVLWGEDVNPQVERYHGRMPLLYYHQARDFGIELPADVPILCISRFLLSDAQKTWPANPQFYLPPVFETFCRNQQQERDIDVLVVTRKLPPYVVEELVPRLRPRCRVEVADRFLPRQELFALFNRSKVYLYAFGPQRSRHHPSGWRVMEGISTQDLEAMACGCTVVSDLRGGQADFVEPWSHGYRLMCHSPAWDLHQVLHAVATWPQARSAERQAHLQAEYGEDAFHRRVQDLLAFLADFYTFAAANPPAPAVYADPPPISRRQRLIEALYRQKVKLFGKRSR